VGGGWVGVEGGGLVDVVNLGFKVCTEGHI
jgi:hypothetical protein